MKGSPRFMTIHTFAIEGMHCAACAATIERALCAIPEVVEANVNFALKTARITAGESVSAEILATAVKNAGYAARDLSADHENHRQDPWGIEAERRRAGEAWRRFALSLSLSLPALVAHFVHLHDGLGRAVVLAAAIAQQIIIGAAHYRRAANALRNGAADMDTLVALGTTVSLLTGILSPHDSMPLMDAALILTVTALGRAVEASVQARALGALTSLAKMIPHRATVERDGKILSLPIEEIAVGECVSTAPGERIPLDGKILSGDSEVSAAWVTGESVPIAKRPGDAVSAGMLNESGLLRIRVTHSSTDSSFAHTMRLTAEAQGSKMNLQRTVDRVTAWFVPAVVLLALATIVAWKLGGATWSEAARYAAAVLMAACPCALGLATPLAVLGAGFAGARRGILVKNAQAFETAGTIDFVAFDKTGTLTTDRPSIEHIAEIVPRALWLPAAAAIEGMSRHPAACAISSYGRERFGELLPYVAASQIVPGRGVTGIVGGQAIAVGRIELLKELGIAIDPALQAAAAERENRREQIIAVAIAGRSAALLFLAESIVEGAENAVKSLKQAGVAIAVLSGDRQEAVERIAARLGIEEAMGDLLPAEKLTRLRAWRTAGKRIAMIGDGLNDAPALAAADLGIAYAHGAETAAIAADVIVLRDDLSAVPETLHLARRTLQVIRGNLWWAFAYNGLLLPFAAGALVPWFGVGLSPSAAALAMAGSSLAVVLSSLRLLRE